MEEHTFQRNKTSLFYRRWPGPAQRTLVMFHGLASNGTRWREFADLAYQQCDWQIVCPDLRGHGHSNYRGKLTSEHWMDDLLALLDWLGCERAVIGGHCLGANLAMRFALHHPDRVQGLVLVEPMFPAALHGVMRFIRPIRWLLPIVAWPVRVLNAMGIHRRSVPVLDLTELDRKTRAEMAEHGSHEAMVGRYAKPNKDMFFMPVATYLQSLFQVLRKIGPIEEIQAPALALLSSGALLADPENSRKLLGEMPRVQIDQIDALHWIPTEQPEAMTEAIVDFLNALTNADQ